jgi:hypothetical protein
VTTNRPVRVPQRLCLSLRRLAARPDRVCAM